MVRSGKVAAFTEDELKLENPITPVAADIAKTWRLFRLLLFIFTESSFAFRIRVQCQKDVEEQDLEKELT
jgi:hypothetical protein